ncbi:MAG: DUF5615 family PIN-like protein [Mycobacteriales bacterium]
MRFLVDSMLPPRVAELLTAMGHVSVTPQGLGAHNLSDDDLIDMAEVEELVIVTENASDFAAVTTCTVLFVRKSWWRPASLTTNLAIAVYRWAEANPQPGRWPHWLAREFR